MRQKLINLTRPLCRQPRQHIFKIGIRIMAIHPSRLDQTHDRRCPFAAAGTASLGASFTLAVAHMLSLHRALK